MSRLVVLFVSLVAVLGMVACGGDDVSVPSLLDDAGLEPGAGGADATVEGGSGPVADASSPLDGGSLDAALDATVDAGVLGDAGADAETDAAAPASYDLSFTVSGLAGTGLFLADNGADLYAVTGNGTFSFNAKVPSGGRYSVGVLQQPSSPAQTCAFTDPAGKPVAAPSGTIGSAADVPTILVQCTTRTFTVGGTITGLASGATLTVQNEGGDTTTVTGTTASSIPFALNTKVAAGDAYSVGVFGQPSAQSCSVNGGSGTVVSGNVTSVSINCSTNTVTIGGTVTGLAGGAMVLQNNGGDNLTIAANGSFAFARPIPVGSTYLVTVLTPPSTPAQTCVVAPATTMTASADVNDVAVSCTTRSYTISATVSGIASGESLVLANNGGDSLPVTSAQNGQLVSFSSKVASGGLYIVSVASNPATPIAQTCTVAGGAGIVGGADVTNVTVSCSSNVYTVGGNIKLDNGGTFELDDNGADPLMVSTTGSFTFGMPVASGSPYAVTIGKAPAGQSCSITNASGTVSNGDIVTVSIECALVGQQVFTTSGTFTVPDGLTSISVVAVGPGGTTNAGPFFGGGGGGGALCYSNAVAVTAGQQIAITVGAAGSASPTTVLTLMAGGGGNGSVSSGGAGGTGSGGICNGGGAGGTAPSGFGDYGGGGGAAGYQGVGGAGASATTCSATGASGSGGGGGGGAALNGCPFFPGGAGGGVGLLGELAGGAGGVSVCTCAPAQPGGNGSDLGAGVYGGGGAGAFSIPGAGAVRIIWGPNRAFPMINTGDM